VQTLGFLAGLPLGGREGLAILLKAGGFVVELGPASGGKLFEFAALRFERTKRGLALGVGLVKLRFVVGQLMRAGFQLAALPLDFVAGPFEAGLRR
jgi:hypothetical protein